MVLWIDTDDGPAMTSNSMRLHGKLLGYSLEDVVNVTVAGYSCHDIVFESSKMLKCTTDPLPDAQYLIEPIIGSVVVHTLSGGSGSFYDIKDNANFTFNPPPMIYSISTPGVPATTEKDIVIFGRRMAKNRKDIKSLMLANILCSNGLEFYPGDTIKCRTPDIHSGRTGPIVVVLLDNFVFFIIC